MNELKKFGNTALFSLASVVLAVVAFVAAAFIFNATQSFGGSVVFLIAVAVLWFFAIFRPLRNREGMIHEERRDAQIEGAMRQGMADRQRQQEIAQKILDEQ